MHLDLGPDGGRADAADAPMNELEPASFLEILWDFPVYVLRSPVASRRGISPGEGTRRAVGREKSEVVMIQPGFARL